MTRRSPSVRKSRIRIVSTTHTTPGSYFSSHQILGWQNLATIPAVITPFCESEPLRLSMPTISGFCKVALPLNVSSASGVDEAAEAGHAVAAQGQGVRVVARLVHEDARIGPGGCSAEIEGAITAPGSKNDPDRRRTWELERHQAVVGQICQVAQLLNNWGSGSRPAGLARLAPAERRVPG
jgi:hypothetical protein